MGAIHWRMVSSPASTIIVTSPTTTGEAAVPTEVAVVAQEKKPVSQNPGVTSEASQTAQPQAAPEPSGRYRSNLLYCLLMYRFT